MTDDIIKSQTNTESVNSSDSFEQALKLKRDSILEQIRSIDSFIPELRTEYSNKLKELYSNMNTCEQQLMNVQASLKLYENRSKCPASNGETTRARSAYF